MSNILKVTSPIGGYENSNNIKMTPSSNTELQGIQAPVDPQKVGRPDRRNDAGQGQNTQLKLNYESNFNHFIKLLNASPDRVEDLMRLLMEKKQLLVESGIQEGSAEDITGFFSMIDMSETDMAAFLKAQADAGLRFRGPLFDLLRQALNTTNSTEQKAAILEFVRMYADMASGAHITQTIADALSRCRDYMFSKPAGELERMMDQMQYGQQHINGNTEKNTALLKEKILPFLNRYISATHDRGPLRNSVAFISYQLARYENGNMDRLTDSFKRLMGYPVLKKIFGKMDESAMEAVFRKASRQTDGWNREFLEVLRSGAKGENGTQARQISQNVVHSALLNESVYMPVLHLMLPMLVDGKLMYSEMWVDPDDESGKMREESEGRTVKALIKFDIEQLGFFDLFFIYKDGKMDMQLDFPDGLKDREKEIRQNMNRILAENGISLQNLVTGSSAESIPITEAFPKIYERKSGINVRI